MLIREDIEKIDKVRLCNSGAIPDFMSSDELAELRRLALLGLERDARALRIGRAVLKWRETTGNAERIIQCVWAAMPRGNVLRAIAEAMEEP